MKKLIFISGTMGVGKSTVSERLYRELDDAVYLDGDWCWKMHPFVVSEENKRMVLENIAFLLRQFLENPSFQYVVFCWVMQEEAIAKELLRRLEGCAYELYRFKLVCNPDALRARLQSDVDVGLREAEVIERSVARLPLYEAVGGVPLDVGEMTVEETVEAIRKRLKTAFR